MRTEGEEGLAREGVGGGATEEVGVAWVSEWGMCVGPRCAPRRRVVEWGVREAGGGGGASPPTGVTLARSLSFFFSPEA